MLPVHEGDSSVAVEGDGVHDHIAALGGVQDIARIEPAHAIVAVTEDEHHGALPGLLPQSQRGECRVVQRGRATRANAADGQRQLLGRGGRLDRQVHRVREGHQPDPVVRSQGVTGSQRRGPEPVEPRPADAAADIEDEQQRDRRVFEQHGLDPLAHAVVRDGEVIGGESVHRATAAGHEDVDHDRVHPAPERLGRQRHAQSGNRQEAEQSALTPRVTTTWEMRAHGRTSRRSASRRPGPAPIPS